MGRNKIGLLGTLMLFIFSMIVIIANPVQAADPVLKTESAIAPVSQFKDVSSTDNNAIFISYLAEKGIINGFPEGTFRPQEGLTRAQAAVILAKAAGLETPPVNQTGFSDVKDDHWAAANIAAAAKAGYLKGFPDGTYRPEDKLTRAQGIALIMRLSTQKDRVLLPVLKDMEPSHWAAGEMAVALAAEMIGLSADGEKVYPDEMMKRGTLVRALGILLTKDPGLYTISLEGTIKNVKGEIKLIRQGITTPLQNNSSIYLGDTIKSGANASASIYYPDGSSVLIKENTEINIKKSIGRAFIKKDGSSGTAVENLDIDLIKGTVFGALATKHESTEKPQARVSYPLVASLNGMQYFADQDHVPWFQTAQRKKVKMTVDMPWGVAAVRGTFILVSVNQDGSCNISCLTGSAEVSGTSGNTVPLGDGTSSGIVQGGTAGPAVPMSAQDKQAFGNVQDWVINTALQMDINREALPPLLLDIIIEIPNQQADQVNNTLDVVLNALESNGIQLTEQVKNDLVKQLNDLGLDVPSLAEPTINNTSASDNGSNSTSIVTITYSTAGSYGGESSGNPQTINGNVVITVPGVTLHNMVITGNLLLGAGIGSGDVTLNNVKVQGNTLVNGGGSNSVELIDCDLYTVTVDKQTEPKTVRIVAKGGTTVGALNLNSGAKLEESELTGTGAGFSTVTTGLSLPADAEIILTGSFTAVNINAPDLSIQVAGGSIGQMNIASTAGGTALNLAGGVSVNSLQINAQADIGGEGQIETAVINAAGVQLEQIPAVWILGAGVSSVSINEQTICENGQRTTLSDEQITLNTIIGTGDNISFTGLVAGSEVKVYDAALDGNNIAGTLSNIVNGAATFTFTTDLGSAGKNIWVTVTTPPNSESFRVAIAAAAEPVSTGHFSGYIVNALDGSGVPGIQINFRLGINNTTDAIAATVTTDNSGYYIVQGLAAGVYTGQTSGIGFSSVTFNAICVAGTTTTEQNGTIIPVLSEGETRIVLTWGENPSDLDAHLTGPIPNSSSRFETYYSNKRYNYNGENYVQLDLDDTSSYGPETTTIYHQSSGDYIFSVKNYSGNGTLAASSAQVKVYRGSELAVATFNVPNQAGVWWTVFKLNGTTITPINYMSDSFEAGFTATNNDATISAGSLAGEVLAGTFTGGADIAASSALTVTIADASKTNAALILTKGNENSTIKYVNGAQPTDDDCYTGIYAAGSTSISVADNDVIWLLVTAQDGTTKLYYKITVTVSVPITVSAEDSNVMMQADNKTAKDGDVFIFTLTNCTLKDTGNFGEATGVIEFDSLPEGMTYTVANSEGKLLVAFNHAASTAIATDVVMNAVIKPAAVTGSGKAVSAPIAVTLQKNNETITAAEQDGTITAATPAQTATFAVTTANIADGLPVTITWFAADGTTPADAPTGVIVVGSDVASNASTITASADDTSIAGVYYFKATIDGVTSALITLTIAAP